MSERDRWSWENFPGRYRDKGDDSLQERCGDASHGACAAMFSQPKSQY